MSEDERRARLAEAAQLFDRAAEELDRAAAHSRTAAQHFRNGEVPRGGAHAWAAFGHLREAAEQLERQAREHARRSKP